MKLYLTLTLPIILALSACGGEANSSSSKAKWVKDIDPIASSKLMTEAKNDKFSFAGIAFEPVYSESYISNGNVLAARIWLKQNNEASECVTPDTVRCVAENVEGRVNSVVSFFGDHDNFALLMDRDTFKLPVHPVYLFEYISDKDLYLYTKVEAYVDGKVGADAYGIGMNLDSAILYMREREKKLMMIIM